MVFHRVNLHRPILTWHYPGPWRTGKIALTKCKVVRIMTDAFMRTRGGQDEPIQPRFI